MAKKKAVRTVSKNKVIPGQINKVNLATLKTSLDKVVAKLSKEPVYRQASDRILNAIVNITSILNRPLSLEVTAVNPSVFNSEITGYLQTFPPPIGYSITRIDFQLVNLAFTPMTGYMEGFIGDTGLTPDVTCSGTFTLQPGEVFNSFMWFNTISPGSYALKLDFLQIDPNIKIPRKNTNQLGFITTYVQFIPLPASIAFCEYPFLIGDESQLNTMLANALGIQADYDDNGNITSIHALDRNGVFRQIKINLTSSYVADYRNPRMAEEGWTGGFTMYLTTSLLYSEIKNSPGGVSSQSRNFSFVETTEVDVLTASGNYDATAKKSSIMIQGFADLNLPAAANGQPVRSYSNIENTIEFGAAWPYDPWRVKITAMHRDAAQAQAKPLGTGIFSLGQTLDTGNYNGPDFSMLTYFPQETERINYFVPFTRQLPLYATIGNTLPSPDPKIPQRTIDGVATLLWVGAAAACFNPGLWVTPWTIALKLAGCGVTVYGAVTIPSKLERVNKIGVNPPRGATAPASTTPPATSPSGTPGTGGNSTQQGPDGIFISSCFSSFTCPPGWECVNGQCIYTGAGMADNP